MDKEDILRKSREQKEDEGSIHADNSGHRYGYIAFMAIYTFTLVVKVFTNQSYDAECSIFFAYLAAQSYGRYRATKEKSMAIITVLGAIACILFLIIFVLRSMGKRV